MLVSLALIIVDIVTTSVIVSKNNYDYGFLSDLYANKWAFLASFSAHSHVYSSDQIGRIWLTGISTMFTSNLGVVYHPMLLV